MSKKGEGDRENAAIIGRALHLDASAVMFNDLLRDVQAQAQADARPRLHLDTGYAIEAVEDVRQELWRDANTAIVYGDNTLLVRAQQ